MTKEKQHAISVFKNYWSVILDSPINKIDEMFNAGIHKISSEFSASSKAQKLAIEQFQLMVFEINDIDEIHPDERAEREHKYLEIIKELKLLTEREGEKVL